MSQKMTQRTTKKEVKIPYKIQERNETEEDQDNYKTYIYNIDNKTLVSTTNNYRYSYVKYIK